MKQSIFSLIFLFFLLVVSCKNDKPAVQTLTSDPNPENSTTQKDETSINEEDKVIGTWILCTDNQTYLSQQFRKNGKGETTFVFVENKKDNECAYPDTNSNGDLIGCHTNFPFSWKINQDELTFTYDQGNPINTFGSGCNRDNWRNNSITLYEMADKSETVKIKIMANELFFNGVSWKRSTQF